MAKFEVVIPNNLQTYNRFSLSAEILKKLSDRLRKTEKNSGLKMYILLQILLMNLYITLHIFLINSVHKKLINETRSGFTAG
jgi:hypothetical protein